MSNVDAGPVKRPFPVRQCVRALFEFTPPPLPTRNWIVPQSCVLSPQQAEGDKENTPSPVPPGAAPGPVAPPAASSSSAPGASAAPAGAETDSIPEGDLPGQICRVLGKSESYAYTHTHTHTHTHTAHQHMLTCGNVCTRTHTHTHMRAHWRRQKLVLITENIVVQVVILFQLICFN